MIVERLSRDETHTIEYRLRVYSSYMVEDEMDGRIPDEIIANALANCIREYVNSANIERNVTNVVGHYKRKGVFMCPACGQVVKR
jgi:translation initiation factor 2 beta subunit (eIF-2beta)/eIF-5